MNEKFLILFIIDLSFTNIIKAEPTNESQEIYKETYHADNLIDTLSSLFLSLFSPI